MGGGGGSSSGGGGGPARPKAKPKAKKGKVNFKSAPYKGSGGDGGGSSSRPVQKPPSKPGGGDSTKPTKPTMPTKPDAGTGGGQAVEGGSVAAPMSFLGSTTPSATPDRSVTKFVPGAGEGAEDALETVLGGEATQFFGTSPFARAGAGSGEGFLGSRFRQAATDVGLDAAVEAQEFAPEVGGGDIGVGAQGFGSRALIGGEAETIMAEGAESNAVDSETPAEQAPSDVAMDPEYQIPGPGKAYIADYNFSLPFLRNPNVIAFLRGSRGARQMARGPISRGLMSARTGFGRRFG